MATNKKKKGPKTRIQAFLQERYVAFQNIDTVSSRGTSRSVKPLSSTDETLDYEGVARFRLQKIKEYRTRLDQEEKINRTSISRSPVNPATNNWVPIGPAGVRKGQASNRPVISGRVQGIAVTPGGSRIYIGTANGGVWRSEDGGNSWTSMMETFDLDPSPTSTLAPTSNAADSLACGAIALVPGATKNQDVVYVGTGEAHSSLDAMLGVGPIVSNDGGKTWSNPEPVKAGDPTLIGNGFFQLAINPSNTQQVVAATRVGLYRRELISGSSYHWVRKTLSGGAGRVTSVVVANNVTPTFYAVSGNGRVFSSPNGDTWNQLPNGLLPGGSVRTTLAVKHDDPSVIYAFRDLNQNGNIFRYDVTNDPNWRPVMIQGTAIVGNIIGSQGWYDIALTVSPDNVNLIYAGGSGLMTNPAGGIGGANTEFTAALFRLTVTTGIPNVTATYNYIGGGVHADVHALVFTPNDANKLWVGCDGGVFYSSNAKGTGNIFKSKNYGLQTMTMNFMAQHPIHDAVIFCGTQDNGGIRFTGQESWENATPGDGGYALINWKNPREILLTYTNGTYRHSVNGGSADIAGAGTNHWQTTWLPVMQVSGGSLVAVEPVLFYAPLVGIPTPANIAAAPNANARLIAFGSIRLWVNSNFGVPGSAWQSIPSGARPADDVISPIRSILFVNPNLIYVGTYTGNSGGVNYPISGVYRYSLSGGTWTRTRLDTLGTGLPFKRSITSITLDPSDNTNNSIYITLGGSGDFRHVWHCQFQPTPAPSTATWTARSGPGAANPSNNLLDVQHNTLVVDPNNSNNLYVGADIGIWKSVDGGNNWTAYSTGLPDAYVIDLQYHRPRNLLRAATHGRGIFERSLPDTNTPDIELYIRATQLDMGRIGVPAPNNVPDPTDTVAPPATPRQVNFNKSPDIKLDAPDGNGQYKFQSDEEIDFVEFIDAWDGDNDTAAFHATEIITSKVYVTIHNRGVVPANNVRVTLLVANVNSAIPAVPNNLPTVLSNRDFVNDGNWETVGWTTLSNVRVGFPKIAAFDLKSDIFSRLAGANPAPGHKFGILVLVHHDNDNFTNPANLATVQNLTLQHPKAAYREITVTNFTGTIPVLTREHPLAGFVNIPETATVAGAPYDGFLAEAFRLNDDVLIHSIKGAMVSPLVPTGADSHIPSATAAQVNQYLQATSVELTTPLTLDAGVSMVWMASQKITINAAINGQGKGAAQGKEGNFGGSGGGGGAAADTGKGCVIPISGHQFLEGGGINTNGNSLTEDWASRALLSPAVILGGASGGGAAGGAGGGVVILCAPVVEFGAAANINVSGMPGGDTSGGGGGGLVIVIAREMIGVDNSKIQLNGGTGGGSAGAGGTGLFLRKNIN